jgi:hypothetical protein
MPGQPPLVLLVGAGVIFCGNCLNEQGDQLRHGQVGVGTPAVLIVYSEKLAQGSVGSP